MGQTKIANRQIAGGLDGWIPAEETWTYASATTITVPSGAASKYQKGDKIKITNNSATKYFYIVSVADTVLTVTGGSDYTVHDSAISNNFYSKIENPQGFPTSFGFTSTVSGFTPAPSLSLKFTISGGTLIIDQFDVGGTSNATTFSFTIPVAPVAAKSCVFVCGSRDNTVFQTVFAHGEYISGTTVSVYKSFYQGAWTNSGAKGIWCPSFSYLYA